MKHRFVGTVTSFSDTAAIQLPVNNQFGTGNTKSPIVRNDAGQRIPSRFIVGQGGNGLSSQQAILFIKLSEEEKQRVTVCMPRGKNKAGNACFKYDIVRVKL